jgi:hypothetical protein
MSSAAQITANQHNSQLSTGPRSEAGKQKAALNSTRHGFTGQVVLLTAEEAEPYRLFNEAFQKQLAPVGPIEQQLVRAIIDANWRINQLQSTESAIYALGHRQYLDQFSDETPELAAAMARALTFENKRKELDRIHRYESRLNRQLAKDTAQLHELQQTRRERDEKEEERALRIHRNFRKQGKNWDPADFGFVWSTTQLDAMAGRRAILLAAQSNGIIPAMAA